MVGFAVLVKIPSKVFFLLLLLRSLIIISTKANFLINVMLKCLARLMFDDLPSYNWLVE